MPDRTRRPGAGRVNPVSQFVLKVHSRCDLACDHCYVYEHADQSWRGRPIGIGSAVARQSAIRIAEHAAAHNLPDVHVVLHGGEPLLLGEKRLRAVLAELHERISPVTSLDLRIQTNGVRLSPALCDLFSQYGVRVGISLDGDRAANDLHRRFADGRSSHAQVRSALKLLRTPEYQHLYAGILCTVDIANDPVAVLEALLDEHPPRIDFLLPHANWDQPPPRPTGAPTAYADWLTRAFDHWVYLGRPTPVRLFDSIEALAVGGVSQSEGIGPGPVGLLVIETDGEWEQVDSLKSAYDGAPATGMNVFEYTTDEAAAHPAIASRQDGISALCDTCQACPVVDRCGGGLYSHRFRRGTGFKNPSVYCDDLLKLINHIGVPDPMDASVSAGAEPAQQTRTVSDSADLDDAALGAIADRPVDATLFHRLARTRLAITRALFAKVGEKGSSCRRTGDRCAGAAWELLCALDESAPDSVRTVLEHPFARAWAVQVLQSKAQCQQLSCAADLTHLASFALAAAVRAGAETSLKVPLHGGTLYLPTLGAWDLGRGGEQSVLISQRDGMLHVSDEHGPIRLRMTDPVSAEPEEGPIPVWRTSPTIGATKHRVVLEVLDPYRDCHGSPAVDGISAAQVQRWHRTLSPASAALESWAPQHAAQVRACVRTIVPLHADQSGGHLSVTSRHAFGAFGAALPPQPETLAMLMVHEAQHMVLDTVMDDRDLIDPDGTRLIDVAWRPDPRPPSGVLHGVFAFLAIAEVWQARGDEPGPGYDTARVRVREYAESTRRALDQLTARGTLTPSGEAFCAGLYARMRRLRK